MNTKYIQRTWTSGIVVRRERHGFVVDACEAREEGFHIQLCAEAVGINAATVMTTAIGRSGARPRRCCALAVLRPSVSAPRTMGVDREE